MPPRTRLVRINWRGTPPAALIPSRPASKTLSGHAKHDRPDRQLRQLHVQPVPLSGRTGRMLWFTAATKSQPIRSWQWSRGDRAVAWSTDPARCRHCLELIARPRRPSPCSASPGPQHRPGFWRRVMRARCRSMASSPRSGTRARACSGINARSGDALPFSRGGPSELAGQLVTARPTTIHHGAGTRACAGVQFHLRASPGTAISSAKFPQQASPWLNASTGRNRRAFASRRVVWDVKVTDELKSLIAKAATGATLSREEAARSFDTMMSGEATPRKWAPC